ncbi:hypothetical protein VNO78_26026 [Psophocarpus tetragonolobus]|uniref:Uncharacterized protein n=1 Tax=Psophocarpus tetragonolobus TaxID=3891 RepID=A0AAN9RYZ7_PSOTE
MELGLELQRRPLPSHQSVIPTYCPDSSCFIFVKSHSHARASPRLPFDLLPFSRPVTFIFVCSSVPSSRVRVSLFLISSLRTLASISDLAI